MVLVFNYSHTSVSNIALPTITERLAAALTAVEVGMGPGAPTISETVSSTTVLVTICP